MTQEATAAVNQSVMGPAFWMATALFLIAYALIICEKVHKTIVAIFGAAIMIVSGIVTQEEAFYSIDLGVDWNVIFILIPCFGDNRTPVVIYCHKFLAHRSFAQYSITVAPFCKVTNLLFPSTSLPKPELA